MRAIRFIIVGLLALAASVGVAGAEPLGSVTEFSSGLNLAAALNIGIAAGPDGNLWFTDKGTASKATDSRIGKIDPATGAIDEFGITAAGGNPGSSPANGIVAGPDGNIWFTDAGTGANPARPAIGEIDPVTDAVQEFSVGLNPGSSPSGITVGPDGNLWFTDRGTTKAVGVIDPTTHAIAEYPIAADQTSLPAGIAAGPDGHLWFADASPPGMIGQVNPTSHAITLYSSGLNAGSNPLYIAPGPDDNLWFTDSGATKAIGRITTNGAITEFSSVLPTVTSLSGNTLTLSQPATASGSATVTFSTVVQIAITVGSNTATVVSGPIATLVPGMSTSNNFPPGTTITSISGSTLTLSANATGSNAGAPATFSTSVAGVTTSAGSTSLTVSAAGFPRVIVGDTVSGPGIPTGILNLGALPLRIVAGPDGNMWFANAGTGATPTTPAIGMIDPTTDRITEFTKPAGMAAGSRPTAIAVGADGNLWFTDNPTSAVSPQAIGRFGDDAPAASVTPPSVTGAGAVGIPQTCGGDTWSSWAGQQPSHDAFTFDGHEWLRDGSPIADAAGRSYTPGADDVGHQLTCKATVTYLLLAVTVSATSAPVTGNYTATITGTVKGPFRVAAGESVLLTPDAGINGPITVDAGGALDVEGASLNGPLRAHGAATVRICAASAAGPLDISGATGPVTIGDGTTSCTSSHFSGPVSLTSNSGEIQIVDAVIDGPLTVTGNTGTVVDSPNTVHGPSRLQ